MKTVQLKKNQDRRLRSGYIWVFSNEISGDVKGAAEPGSLVRIVSSDGRFMGIGHFNPHSLIAVRLLSRHEEAVDAGFFERAINAAFEYRKKVYPNLTSYRLVAGEADFLPGLIIDKYEDYCSLKIMSYGMKANLNDILQAIDRILNPSGIFYSIDERVSILEGMETASEWVKGSSPGGIEIIHGKAKFHVNIEKGQKTGFFFDQFENRKKIESYVAGRTVLDCFCYSGAFSVYCSLSGSESVTGVDISREAVEEAGENARLNNLNNCTFIEGDVFKFIREINSRKYSYIILDPPAFIKSKKDFKKGYNKYLQLNIAALKIIEEGGGLFTSSCSHHLDLYSFIKMLGEAAGKAKRRLRISEFGFQSKDHPVLAPMPETRYLKGAFCFVA